MAAGDEETEVKEESGAYVLRRGGEGEMRKGKKNEQQHGLY